MKTYQKCSIVTLYAIWINPLTPKISLVILPTVYHIVLVMLV